MVSLRPELYRKQDYHTALREHASILDCTKAVENSIQSGELEEAQLFVKDINKSLEALKQLEKKKQQENDMKLLLERLVAAGIDVMVVKRYVQ